MPGLFAGLKSISDEGMFKMPSSMTGYGRAARQLNGKDISVEIKSVNHRFFEFGCRAQRSYSYLEDGIKKRVQEKVSRGKVDLSLSIQNVGGEALTIKINEEAAAAYAGALNKLAQIAGISAGYTVDTLTRFPEIFSVEKQEDDEEALWRDVCEVLDEALAGFVDMRNREGGELVADLLRRLESIEENVTIVEAAGARIVEDYRKRLYAKLGELLADKGIDENRILTEAALFADRTDVGEETVRLRSHIGQYRAILSSGEPVGRKLDFLTQELNREVNTIGSKIQDVEISKIVVSMKSDIEKIREQIQNLE